MKRILVIWGNWGPYHYARFAAFRTAGKLAGYEVEGLELFPSSGHYEWEIDQKGDGIHHINIGPVESRFHPWRMTRLALPRIFSLRPDVVFVPSYWHWSLFINFFVRLIGCKVVMMNESHGGTEKASGWKRSVKRTIVRSFHAAFVGGTPHRDYFSALGLAADRIFTGYDAVDSDYFAKRSREAKESSLEFRLKMGLPHHYFLSLGRMVEKKNLSLLLRAFAQFRQSNPEAEQHLVFVGSGDEEAKLRDLCQQLGLPVQDHDAPGRSKSRKMAGESDGYVTLTEPEAEPSGAPVMTEIGPAVHFFGFRQIKENPIFYALADAFILPSHTEEWGLVVNEAMACGLPVIVSRTVGSAPDLVRHGKNGFSFDPDSESELAGHLETLARDPGLREEMGKESAVRIAHWGLENFAENGIRAAEAAKKKGGCCSGC